MKKYDKILRQKLKKKIDLSYASHHCVLVPGKSIMGVTVPDLRTIAKEFSAYDDFLENVSLDIYENISVACYYIGIKVKTCEELKPKLDFVLPYVDTWSVCDSFVTSLKCLSEDKTNEFVPILYEYLHSGEPFTQRFAIVSLMRYYLQKADLVKSIFEELLAVQGDEYYVNMAIAWLISEAFVSYKTLTLHLLQSGEVVPDVLSKSIAKICESYRVSDADKELVKKLRLL